MNRNRMTEHVKLSTSKFKGYWRLLVHNGNTATTTLLVKGCQEHLKKTVIGHIVMGDCDFGASELTWEENNTIQQLILTIDDDYKVILDNLAERAREQARIVME